MNDFTSCLAALLLLACATGTSAGPTDDGLVEAGAQPPAPPPVTVTTEQPRGLAEWQTGPLPGGVLFRPLVADPRWPHFAASWQRYVDDRQLADVAAVSFGESFALYRDRIGRGWWEFGLHAGVFAVFDLDAESADLVNADYLVGFPLTYRVGDFSAILRLFHQSSHLGDEFLLRTRSNRVNLSYESVDLRLSYEIGTVLRLYGGGGYLFHQEPSNLDPLSAQYGIELTSPWPGPDARWRPIAAVDIQHREENGWIADVSARAGLQIEGVLATRRLQILFEYFNGHSPNGQFYKDRVEYFGLGTHFHF
ncbi:MAG: DUF1207 domain-containing protein [Candidatus Rokuibacteriota bacterium]|nr:MAG: DUF1207 domain-containing protein [Candidatus Rokubacteria bacterium]